MIPGRGASDPARRGRYTALDGLRGIAALVVVVHHGLLVAPSLADAYGQPPGESSGWAWWLTYTPLHILWAGPESVYLFFVLSGFVLTLPFAGGGRWRGYYPRRLIRLYLPVWGAIVFTLLTFAAVRHEARPGQSWWLNEHDTALAPGGLLHEAALIIGDSSYINTPLWSLKWEVLFSLLLPLYLFAGRLVGRYWLPVGGLVLVFVAVVDAAQIETLTYLPMFALGVLMALHRDELAEFAGRLGRRGWAMLTVSILLLLTADWTLHQTPGARALPVLGGALLVFAFLGNSTSARIGDCRPAQWLGKRSFSLYLVHEPIVVSVGFALATNNPLSVLAVALPVSLAVASMFYVAVERPAHRLANTMGRRFDRPGQLASTRHVQS